MSTLGQLKIEMNLCSTYYVLFRAKGRGSQIITKFDGWGWGGLTKLTYHEFAENIPKITKEGGCAADPKKYLSQKYSKPKITKYD